MGKLGSLWNNYKYRSVPWLLFNWRKNTTVRHLPKDDFYSSEMNILENLVSLLYVLEKNESLKFTPKSVISEIYTRNCNVMKNTLGFSIQKKKSQILDGGLGVLVSKGKLCKGQLAALYPGTIYHPTEPIFFQSCRNQFILRCKDGVLVDGNHKNISKYIYKSCVHRDRLGHYLPADLTWLDDFPLNPLSIGQFVNNQSKTFPANVVYQECNLPLSIPSQFLQLIPNITYSPPTGIDKFIRIVALIATRDIEEGEELFSSYFSVVH